MVEEEYGPQHAYYQHAVYQKSYANKEEKVPSRLDSYSSAILKEHFKWVTDSLLDATEAIKLQIYTLFNAFRIATYSELSLSSRLSVLSPWTIISVTGAMLGFIVWFLKVPHLNALSLLITPAYADDKPDPYKSYIILTIFIALLITFILSIWVLLFKKEPSERALQFADFMAKGLFGVFVGALGTYLGIAHA